MCCDQFDRGLYQEKSGPVDLVREDDVITLSEKFTNTVSILFFAWCGTCHPLGYASLDAHKKKWPHHLFAN